MHCDLPKACLNNFNTSLTEPSYCLENVLNGVYCDNKGMRCQLLQYRRYTPSFPAKIKPGTVSVPGLRLRQRFGEDLLHLVQFYAVPRMHILQGEDDHAGRRGVRHTDDHDLAHRSARQVPHVNH